MEIKDMTGLTLGGVTGIRFLRSVNNRALWLWRCHCGTEFERFGAAVRMRVKKVGHTSCGCEHTAACIRNGKNNRTHGLSKTKLYDVHRQMLRRCFDPECKDFCMYGARGIKVCEPWKDLKTFIDWALVSGYREGLTIERVQSSSDYEPSNCKWIPMSEQGKNTRRCKFLTFEGRTLTMSDWARVTGINVRTIIQRVNRNWPVEKLLTQKPIRLRDYAAQTIPANPH